MPRASSGRPDSDDRLVDTTDTDPGFVARVRRQGERVHIPLGASCNNNCLFCMEDDRDARERVNSAMTPERVRWIIDRHKGAEELCFTSGEPTLHPRLPEFIRWSRESGYQRVSLMTNGRRFGYPPYAATLVHAGLNRVYVSIHGHTSQLHDGMTRTPKSFDQTVAGLKVAASLRTRNVDLHTSTVVTRRNVTSLLEIYEMLMGLGVQQVVFNALQVSGRTVTHFDRVMPRYTEIRGQFDRVLCEAGNRGRGAFLVDVPPCISEGLPDRNRGFVEAHVHYEATLPDIRPPGATECEGSDGVRSISTANLDDAFRSYGSNCEACRYRSVCTGVYKRYVEVHGWDEFKPVSEEGQGHGRNLRPRSDAS